jgi:hypothetical protein
MPCCITPRGRLIEFNSPQCKCFRRRQIAGAMLVVDRKRLDRFA